jgi:hypothetical protein
MDMLLSAPLVFCGHSIGHGIFLSVLFQEVLKRALFLSAFAALRAPVSRAYYARKVSRGQRHNQALIALAGPRCDVMYAIVRDGTLYCPKPLETA